MALVGADILGGMRFRRWYGHRRSGLVGDVAGLAVRLVNPDDAIVERIGDRGNRVRVGLVVLALFPGRFDDAKVLVLENYLINGWVGLVGRRRTLRYGGKRSHGQRCHRAKRKHRTSNHCFSFGWGERWSARR